jgi:uncharacterized lipoprotein YddW (UPF0748 family)
MTHSARHVRNRRKSAVSNISRICICVTAVFLLLVSPGAGRCGVETERGLFVSVIQDPQVLSSREAIAGLIGFARKARVADIFIQVHYANRSWFPSKIADQSPYEACLICVPEDPLRLLIDKAHASGIRVHAWINVLSLCDNKDAPILARYGPEVLTRNTGQKRVLEDYKIDCQYFLEPGDERVRHDLSGIVEEIVRSYPGLDGVQFDYIRYPDKDPAYGHTDANIRRFKEATGRKTADECDETWRQWKRDRVTDLLGLLAKKAREIHPGITVSATGCMPYTRALQEAFQDWPSWIRLGVVDFVTVMSYSPYSCEFERWIERIKGRAGDFSKVRIAVGAYKLLGLDAIFRRELEICEDSGAGGFVIFHYGSLLEDPELGSILKNE